MISDLGSALLPDNVSRLIFLQTIWNLFTNSTTDWTELQCLCCSYISLEIRNSTTGLSTDWLICRMGQEEFQARYLGDPHWATPHSKGRQQSAVSQQIHLVHKPVHHRCPAEDRLQPASGQLSSPHRTTTVSSVSSVHTQRRDSAASSMLFVLHVVLHLTATAPTVLNWRSKINPSNTWTLDTCRPYWTESGPWQHPPPPNCEWDRKRAKISHAA